MRKIIASLALAFSLVTSAQAKERTWPELGVETRIPFANNGGIDNFRPDGDYGLWIQDRTNRWYYATFFGRCSGLTFAQSVGFETDATSSFDRFSSVRVEGRKCAVNSLVTAEKPLSGKALKQLQESVREAGRKAVAES